MKKRYYLFNPGRVSRRDNTLKIIPVDKEGNEGKAKYLPIEGVKSLYIFGSIDANSALFNFLGKAQIPVHFFDYYKHYTGSFMPKDYLLAGKMQIEQTRTYLNNTRRMHLATQLVEGAAYNMIKNVQYYQRRKGRLEVIIDRLKELVGTVDSAQEVQELMGIEGNTRMTYYSAFEQIIENFDFEQRVRNPPSNEVNALISFGNMMCYTLALDQIYHTQLNPTVSFLHEPGYRRYSLALDIAEIFKPMLVDRTIFRITNRREIKKEDFERGSMGCLLKEKGRKTFIRAFEERLNQTIQHRSLNKKVSYKHLVRLECYKIAKYCLGIEKEYQPFKIWW